MADIIRLFNDDHQRPHALDSEGEVFEIANMIDAAGYETNDLDEAESIVIKLDEQHWLALDVHDKVPWADRKAIN